MTEQTQKQGLSGLKPQAESTLFADWRVTPEMKERLHRRIRVAEKGARPAPARGWWWKPAAMGAAAVAVLVVGLSMDVAPKTTQQTEEKAAVERERSGGPAQRPMTPPPPDVRTEDVILTTVTGAPAAAPKVTVATSTVSNANGRQVQGNAITFTAADKDAYALSSPAVPGVEVQPGRKIILNAEYQLKVTDGPRAMQQLQEVANSSGGYLVDAALNKGEDGSYNGTAVLRIPAGLYGGAIQQVRRIGEIRQERQYSQDVTEAYMDLEARIRIQTEYEAKLKELAAKAATFDDWMRLTQQINSTRAEIERMQGSLKLMANRVEYSSIHVSITQPAPEAVAKPKPEPEKGLWAQMAWSFGESVRVLGNMGKRLLVNTAGAAPFLLAGALALGALVGAVRSRRRSRKEA